ncbi:MAG: ADP-ribosylglycohydrolase family protein, partial [Armatimonadetes bacterium]|nr:ADP-ribosylglycohydrolase family protein [Candidatus Hippobium faecium]
KYPLSYETYLNKVEGCWLGKSLAGVIGAPFEGQKIFEELKPEQLWPKVIFPNDDLDIQIIWLEMMEEIGTDFTSIDLANFWLDRCWYSFAEYGYFTNNYQRGIDPPLSGVFNNNFFKESEGCPIRAEIWAMVCPGNPKMAAEFAKLDGQQDHTDNSVWAEMFWAAANAQAFVTEDVEEIVNAGLSVIPEDSDIAQIVYDVFMVLENCDTLKKMWLTLIRTWGDRDCSKSKLNFAFSLLSLLYGEMDFKKTMACACSLTWDTDCTAGTACSLLGTIIGADKFPSDWLDKLGKDLTCDVNAHRHKGVPIHDFAKDTCLVGIENMINKNYSIDILDIPEEIYEKACDNYYSRREKKPLEISVSYEIADNVPALIEGKASCELVIKNSSNRLISGLAKLEADDEENLSVTFMENNSESIEFEVDANSEERLPVFASVNDDQNIIWQKNLVTATIETEEENYEKIFGFAGSNHWTVYGPYWETFDKTKYSESPYRNADLSNNWHPCHKGEGFMMFHQYVDINTEYLDEATLLKEEIEEEFPFKVECPEFLMTNEDISHHMGETCYYFTRTIVAEEDYDAKLHVGCSGPFVIYVNGQEVMRNNYTGTWSPDDNYAPFDMKEGEEYRIVVKALQITDEFKFSFDLNIRDYPESKEYGKSIFLDNYGDKTE